MNLFGRQADAGPAGGVKQPQRIPESVDMSHPWGEQAAYFVAYYEAVDTHRRDDVDRWALGLLAAKQWARLLEQPEPDLEEATLLLRVLEAERPTQGSAWSDLYFRVKYWLEEVTQSS